MLAGHHSSTAVSGVTTGTFGMTAWMRSSTQAINAEV